MIRFKIAVEPMQNGNSDVVLFGATTEWNRFIDHMRNEGQSVLADMLASELQTTATVSRISLPKTQAQRILRFAGLVL